MLKALVNEARLRLDITTQGPLLIKTGYATVIGADMSPVVTSRNGQPEIYLPGTSLKGVFRSHIEKVVNSIQLRTACNPLLHTNDEKRDERQLYRSFCGDRFTNSKAPAHETYAGSCPVCRLFGSTAYIGRISIEDAYLPAGTFDQQKTIERRDGIAIDRLTGGTSGNAKFDLEVVTAGTTFTTELQLRNFEIWQLGMLFIILQDMEDELIRIGSGRSRGLGKITARINNEEAERHPGGIVLSTTRTGTISPEPDDTLWGLGRWLTHLDQGSAKMYGTEESDLLTLPMQIAHLKKNLRFIRIFKGEDLTRLKERCTDIFLNKMQQWKFEEDAPAAAPSRR